MLGPKIPQSTQKDKFSYIQHSMAILYSFCGILGQTTAYPFWRGVVKMKEDKIGRFYAVDDHDNV